MSTKAAFPKQDWTPRRRGAIYCSPACGGNCTYAAFLAAIKAGDKLAARCGPGYTRRVWENLGWHFQAEISAGRLRVHRDRWDSFSAYLGEYCGKGKTPKAAIQQVVDIAKAHIRQIQASIEGLEP